MSQHHVVTPLAVILIYGLCNKNQQYTILQFLTSKIDFH